MNKKISDLQENLPIDGTENIANQKGTDNFKNTYTQLKDWVLTFVTTVFIQTKRPLKTVGGESLEGPGNIEILDSAEWGNITGTLSNQTDLQSALDDKAEDVDLTNHINDNNNPHSVTATQVGLGNVDNTSDLDKPVSTATQTALDNKINYTDNPSKTQAGGIRAFDDPATSTLIISIDGTNIP
jgi:hypothetical protein